MARRFPHSTWGGGVFQQGNGVGNPVPCRGDIYIISNILWCYMPRLDDFDDVTWSMWVVCDPKAREQLATGTSWIMFGINHRCDAPESDSMNCFNRPLLICRRYFWGSCAWMRINSIWYGFYWPGHLMPNLGSVLCFPGRKTPQTTPGTQ